MVGAISCSRRLLLQRSAPKCELLLCFLGKTRSMSLRGWSAVAAGRSFVWPSFSHCAVDFPAQKLTARLDTVAETSARVMKLQKAMELLDDGEPAAAYFQSEKKKFKPKNGWLFVTGGTRCRTNCTQACGGATKSVEEVWAESCSTRCSLGVWRTRFRANVELDSCARNKTLKSFFGGKK